MAYYSDKDEQSQAAGEGANQAVNKPGSGLVQGSSSGSTSSAAPMAAVSETAKESTPGASGRFVGINDYLNANKQQSEKLGKTVGGVVEGKIDSAQNKLNDASKAFGQNIDRNTVTLNQDDVNLIKSDPTKIVNDPNRMARVKAQSQGYAGPTDFQSDATYQGVKQDLDKAKTAVGQLGDAKGQTDLLTNYQLDTRGGKLNRGAATLDQGLLGASEQARAALVPTQQKGAQFESNIDKTIQDAMAKIAQAQQTSANTNQAMQNLYNEQFTNQQQALQQRASQVNQNLSNQMADIKQRAINAPETLTDQELAYMGTDRGTFNQLRNDLMEYAPKAGSTSGALSLIGNQVNLGDLMGKYFSVSNPNANMQNVVNQDDIARAQALRQLAGFGGEYINPGLAGTYNKDLIDFNAQGLKDYLAPLIEAAKKRDAQLAGGGGGDDGGGGGGGYLQDRGGAIASNVGW